MRIRFRSEPGAKPQLCHTLKGSSANLGLAALAELTREMESMARSGDASGLRLKLSDLENAFDEASSALRELGYGENQPPIRAVG